MASNPDNMIIIGDDTSENVTHRAELGRGMMERDWQKVPYASGPLIGAESIKIIPREVRKEMAAEQEAKKTRLRDIMDLAGVKIKNQKQTSLCWAFATVHGMEAVRAFQGKETISLSPASVAGPINNWRNRGGWGTAALEYMIANGVLPSSVVEDTDYSCKAIVNDEENIELAKQYKCTEWCDIPQDAMEDYVESCVLQHICVSAGYNWWGHQVLITWITPTLDYGIDNSWGYDWSDNGRGLLTGRKKIPNDACAPRVAA